MSGELLPNQLLYQGKPIAATRNSYFLLSLMYGTLNHWANKDTTIQFIQHIICSSCVSQEQHTTSSFLSHL